MYTYVIPCLLGLEKLVSDEVKRLGLQDVRAENGRVLCRGTLEDCARLNINLRCGARVMLVLAELIILGALMYDGFMDTSDGVFSARDRERMLEIMKDSHVGSNAVIALVCLVLLKVAAYTTLPPVKLSFALVAVFVATRTFMVTYIVNYKYARKTGIGHMFKAYAKPMYTYIAFALCLALVAACGLPYLYTAIAAFVICQGIAHFLSGQLGGLTGDTYGFLTECGVVVYLMLATYII